ncbi:hypothetical protein [Aquabacterium humicola]|uniref:hypothetical protein n=1 Tax=Aquabacterium humicola TaxID=3237377 RepID=UPI002543F84D|nr:hypothetical protein [Rubrivivax pictus]
MNVAAAFERFVRQPHTYALTGSTNTGVAVTATLTIAQGLSTSSRGRAYDVTSVTMQLRNSSGAVVGSGTASPWFLAGTVDQAFVATSDGTCAVTSSGTKLPTSASVGQNGPYVTATEYAGCSTLDNVRGPISSGTRTQTWSVNSIEGGTYACLHTSRVDFFTTTESDCVQVVDARGNLGGGVRVTLKDANGVTTTLSN